MPPDIPPRPIPTRFPSSGAGIRLSETAEIDAVFNGVVDLAVK